MINDDDSAIAKWLAEPYNLDGWRIDVANMTGRYADVDNTLAVARRLRERAVEIRPDAGIVAEHFFDYTRDLPGDGWHAAMNYSGFSRPVWEWLSDPGPDAKHFGLPIAFSRSSGRSMYASMREWAARVPWQVAAAQWNMLGSHDTPRMRNRLGSRANVELASALLFTYLGTPMLFQGDEIGALGGVSGEHARIAMPWDQTAGGPRWDNDVLATFRDLSRLRRDEKALREGGLRWAVADDDAIAYLRKTEDERLLVVVARDAWTATLPRWILGADAPELIYGGHFVATPDLDITADGLRLSTAGPAVGVWRLA
jgi:alpha-glucosidase